MKHDIVLYILVMTVVTLAIRLVPLTLLRRPIKNRCLRSFLYYVPYVTLAVMTFPAIVEATQIPAAGGAALLAGIALAWVGASLFQVDEIREDFQAALQDAVQMSDECAVVRHGHALIFCAFHAIEHLALIEHAAAAVDDETILLQILGEGLAA